MTDNVAVLIFALGRPNHILVFIAVSSRLSVFQRLNVRTCYPRLSDQAQSIILHSISQ